MQRAHTIERNELVIEMYKSGKTIKEISKEMNLGKEYTRKILVEAGVVTERTCNRISMETRDRILEMLKESIPYGNIAAECGVTISIVSYYAYAYNLTTPSISKEQVETMLQLRKEGLNNNLIANRMGISYMTVIKHIGSQPAEITKIYTEAGVKIHQIRKEAQALAKGFFVRKEAEEAERIERERLEAERLERERIEALRVAKENEIKEMLSALGIPADSIRIESVEAGTAFLNNLITRATELSAGA